MIVYLKTSGWIYSFPVSTQVHTWELIKNNDNQLNFQWRHPIQSLAGVKGGKLPCFIRLLFIPLSLYLQWENERGTPGTYCGCEAKRSSPAPPRRAGFSAAQLSWKACLSTSGVGAVSPTLKITHRHTFTWGRLDRHMRSFDLFVHILRFCNLHARSGIRKGHFWSVH